MTSTQPDEAERRDRRRLLGSHMEEQHGVCVCVCMDGVTEALVFSLARVA